MSFLIGEISANVRADTSQFKRGMRDVERTGARSSRRTQRSLGGIGNKLKSIAFLAKTAFVSSMVMGARQAVREFAQLEGAMAKFNVVFGEQAREVEAWVNEFREGVPLARREIIAAAASMQDLLVPMGVAREDASEMTREWLELASALAAFNDVPVDQALEAIRSGIAGQSRPLRQFGIDARETALQQTALAEGLIRAGEEMDDQVRQKALLIQSYSQSKDAVDGYEDQLGSTLMKEQELGATYKDTAAILGEMLQPAYNAMTDASVSFLQQLSGDLRTFQFITKAITGNVKTLTDQWKEFTQISIDDLGVDEVRSQIQSLNHEMEAMIRRQGEQGISEDAVRASEQYKILEGRLLVVQAILSRISDDTNESNDAAEDFARTVERVRVAMEQPEDSIFDPSVIRESATALRDLEEIMKEIEGDDTDFESRLFMPGSIGRMREEIQDLEEALIRTTDPEKAQGLQEEIERLNEKIREMREGTESLDGGFSELSASGRFFTNTLADGLDQVLFRARSVEDALQGIARQLATRAISTLLMGAVTGGFGGSFLGAMFGGFRSSGGQVQAGKAYRFNENNQDEMFMPSTNGQVVSPQQMQSQTLSTAQIERAFSTAMAKHIRGVSDRKIFEMSEQGRFS